MFDKAAALARLASARSARMSISTSSFSEPLSAAPRLELPELERFLLLLELLRGLAQPLLLLLLVAPRTFLPESLLLLEVLPLLVLRAPFLTDGLLLFLNTEGEDLDLDRPDGLGLSSFSAGLSSLSQGLTSICRPSKKSDPFD